MRPIDADTLSAKMYHDAFETDSDMQKWDSGCWIRYGMFEKNLKDTPTIDAVPVVRCKDCKFEKDCTQRGFNDDFCSSGRRKDETD